ncbi:MAG: hypothetical protein AB1544_05635 [Pseudomonadota bacterium]|jgi:hypothetical protein
MKPTTLLAIAIVGMPSILNGCSNGETELTAKQQQIRDKYIEETRAASDRSRKALGMPPREEKR